MFLENNKTLQYAVLFMFNYEEIGKSSEKITKNKPITNKHNWREINFLSEKEKNNITIALNVLYAKKEKMFPAYLSKYNSNSEKQQMENDSIILQ